jgi:hypothetical protein
MRLEVVVFIWIQLMFNLFDRLLIATVGRQIPSSSYVLSNGNFKLGKLEYPEFSNGLFYWKL